MTDYEEAADRWWDPARKRALITLVQRSTDEERDMSDEEFSLRARAIKDRRWVPLRPERYNLSPIWNIVTYWAGQGVFPIVIGEPACFACQIRAPLQPDALSDKKKWNWSNGWLEKSHLVNRCEYGLDGVQNLVPLCRQCNRAMPVFGDGPSAIAWILRGGWVAEFAERLKQEPDHTLARRIIGQALGA